MKTDTTTKLIDSLINFCYLEVLERDVDPSGLMHYRAMFQDGRLKTSSDLERELKRSKEYSDLCRLREANKPNPGSGVEFSRPNMALFEISDTPQDRIDTLSKVKDVILFVTYGFCSRAYKEYHDLTEAGLTVVVAYAIPTPLLSKVRYRVKYKFDPDSLKTLVEKLNPAIIHVHNTPDIQTHWLREYYHKTIIHDIHDVTTGKREFESAIAAADVLVTVGDELAGFLSKHYDKPVKVVYSKFANPRRIQLQKLSESDGKIHIGFIGSLYAPTYAVKECNRLSKWAQKNGVHIHIHANYHRPIVAEYVNPYFHLEEMIDIDDIPTVLSQYDCGFVNGASTENIPILFGYEGLAFSLPNKFWDYRDAGIPIVVEAKREVCGKLASEGGFGIVIDDIDDITEDDLRNLDAVSSNGSNVSQTVLNLEPYRKLLEVKPTVVKLRSAEKDDDIDVLILCRQNTAGVVSGIVDGINKNTDVRARFIQFEKMAYNYPIDTFWNEDIERTKAMIRGANHIHVNSLHPHEFSEWMDIRNLIVGKPLSKHYHGFDLRSIGKTPIDNVYRNVFVSTPDLTLYHPTFEYMPNPIFMPDEWLDGVESEFPTKTKILHNPSSTMKIKDYVPKIVNLGQYPIYNIDDSVKDTGTFNTIMESISKDVPVEYQSLEKLTLKESIAAKSKCTFYFDQMWLGYYGVSAIESMALGKPAMCRLSDATISDMRCWADAIGCEIPIPLVKLSYKNLRQNILSAIKLDAREVGEESRAWVNEFHSPKTIAQIFLEKLGVL